MMLGCAKPGFRTRLFPAPSTVGLPLVPLDCRAENISQSNKDTDLLSVEKAPAAASTASAASSSTPRQSRPITTLFLLTVVSFVPSFYYCVTAHHHHPSAERHRCQPLDASSHSFFSAPLARPPPPALYLPLTLSSYFAIIDQQQQQQAAPQSDRTITDGVRQDHAVQSLLRIYIRETVTRAACSFLRLP